MPFSQDIKANALIASGRRCCICHKFCGVRIECHHIVPEGQGGSNLLDNCIPLCFDCHSEVEHYNAQHPKGNKFSVDELRGHRDRWYQKHKVGGDPEATIFLVLAKVHRRSRPNRFAFIELTMKAKSEEDVRERIPAAIRSHDLELETVDAVYPMRPEQISKYTRSKEFKLLYDGATEHGAAFGLHEVEQA